MRSSVVVCWTIFAAVSLRGQSPAPTSETRGAEIERLQKLAEVEKDPKEQGKLWQEIWDLRQKQYQESIPPLRQQWSAETDPKKKREIGKDLVYAAIHTDQPRFALEVATDGKLEATEIKIPDKDAIARPLLILKSFDPEPYPYEDQAKWVIRRMTLDRFELWLPHHGWLFDARGKVVNTAQPPRRDGMGRTWYGAFLPDGRWVTTDIWEYDRTLHFFSKGGKWRKELTGDNLVPRTSSDEERWRSSVIGWCRCDKDGRGFVLSVGTDGGRGDAWVSADGARHHRLTKDESPWKMCYPRDLEPKGMYTCLSVPNDRGNEAIGYTVPSHGNECSYPTYRWSDASVQISGPGAFGFWPGSSNVYIETDEVNPPSDTENEASDEAVGPPPITLFYNFAGTFCSWIRAARISDTSARDGMIFHDKANRIITITPDLRVNKVERFVLPAGGSAAPEKLFPDLRLGFFKVDKKLVLARW